MLVILNRRKKILNLFSKEKNQFNSKNKDIKNLD